MKKEKYITIGKVFFITTTLEPISGYHDLFLNSVQLFIFLLYFTQEIEICKIFNAISRGNGETKDILHLKIFQESQHLSKEEICEQIYMKIIIVFTSKETIRIF